MMGGGGTRQKGAGHDRRGRDTTGGGGIVGTSGARLWG